MNSQGLDLIEVSGFCMWPFLRNGQKVLVRKISLDDFRPGDLVLYRTEEGLHCHRLLCKEKAKDSWVFHCRPDNATSKGEPIDDNMVEGKVVAVLNMDRVINLETPLSRIYAILILVVLSPIIANLDKLYRKIKGV